MKKHKIFLGAQEISGVMKRMESAFKDMGYKCDFYCLYEYVFDKYDYSQLPLLKKYRKHTDKIRNTKIQWKKNIWYIVQMFDILHILLYSLFVYTDYIYIFGHGMFLYNKYLKNIQELEFFILKLFHKHMVMWLCGSDSRAPYCDVDVYDGDIDKLYQDTRLKAKKIKMLEKYMILIDNTASSHFHKKPYIIYNCIGIPIDEKERVQANSHDNEKICVLHAPSNQKAKGTDKIQNALKELQEEGYEFEYVAVHGVSHKAVLEKIAQADIVIDQLYSDTPMAGFASEAAINGIPVIVGGYYAEYYHKVKNNPDIPTVFCTPDKLKEEVVSLIKDKEKRINIGKQQRRYVEENCTSEKVANKFLSLLDKNIPLEWYFDPRDNDYPFGCGIVKEDIVNNIVKLIDKYGEEALALNQNIILYKTYMDLYKNNRKLG